MAATFSLAGTLKITPKWVDARGVTDITDTAIATHTIALLDGIGAGEANAYWKDQISVVAGAPVTIDLRSLAHKAFGGVGSLSFSAVKLLIIANTSADSRVAIGGATADPWVGFSAGSAVIGTEGVLYSANPGSGWAVSTGSRALQITNLDTVTAAVNVYIVGVKS